MTICFMPLVNVCADSKYVVLHTVRDSITVDGRNHVKIIYAVYHLVFVDRMAKISGNTVIFTMIKSRLLPWNDSSLLAVLVFCFLSCILSDIIFICTSSGCNTQTRLDC